MIRAKPSSPPATPRWPAAPPLRWPACCRASLNKTWIEVLIVNADNQPLPHVRCSVKLPDGQQVEFTTGDDGVGSFVGIDPGQCEIGLPDYDKSAWAEGPAPVLTDPASA